MKKLTALFLALALALSLAACGGKSEPTELVVFAAASLQETLETIGENYTADHPDVSIVYNFDSSGTLKTQIQEGAACDLFISAAPKQMNALDASAPAEKNPDGLDFVLEDTRVDLLENKVVLAVPQGNPSGIQGFDDMAQRLEKGEDILMAIGNSDVPVGQYTQKIFAFYGLDEEKMGQDGTLTYGTNVKEVTSQVTEGAVDCGVIYATDAVSAGLEIADQATKDMCGQVIYPAAVLKVSQQQEQAEDFLHYLQTEAAGEVFASVGFAPLQQADPAK